MPNTWITDLRHFIDSDGLLVEGRAGKLAVYWCRLVEAATVRSENVWRQSAVRCRRHPGRARCPGYIRVHRSDGFCRVQWKCPSCTDRGVISGWEQSPWDLRAAQAEKRDDIIRLSLSEQEYALLCECEGASIDAPVLLASATLERGQILLSATKSELDDVLGHIAADANHTARRHQRKALDALYGRVEEVLARRTPLTRDSVAESCNLAAMGMDQVVEGISTVLGLTPEVRQRYAKVLVQAADDALIELRLRQRIDDTLAVAPTQTNRVPAVVLELEDVLARIRSTGETRPEAALGTLGHLLDAVRRYLRDLPDTEIPRAFCTRLCEVTVAAARRARGSKAETALLCLIDAYLDDRADRWPAVPTLLAQARLGKRIRRRLTAEVALRSDTADPGRAERLTMLMAVLSADRL